DEAPRYLIRDRDRIYGAIVTRRLRAMGIRDKATAAASPWQHGFCRTADRVDATRVYGPHHCLWRGTPAPDSAIVCLLLQPDQNSPVIGQGCADLSPGSADRGHQFARHPWRTPSPLRPSLGFWYTQG